MTVFVAGCAVGALAMFVTLAVAFRVAGELARRRTCSRAEALEAQRLGNAMRSLIVHRIARRAPSDYARGEWLTSRSLNSQMDLVDWPFPPTPAKPAAPTYVERPR